MYSERLTNYTAYRIHSENIFRVKQYGYEVNEIHNNMLANGVPNCERPLFIRSRHQFVPCGHCALCASRAKKDWIVRCNLELQKYRRGEFITLTFDDEHLYDTSYDVVQKFLKRLRKKCVSPFKYFCAYENGDKSGRPHYHILIFGFSRPYPVDPMWFNAYLADIWQQGIVKAVPMTSGNIPYVCGYVQKKLQNTQKLPAGMCRRDFTRLNLHSLNDLELSLFCNQTIHRQEFTKMSKGLGFWWCENLKKVKAVLKRGCFLFGKFRYAIPRALLLKLQQLGNDWLIMPQFSEFLAARAGNLAKDSLSYQSFLQNFMSEGVSVAEGEGNDRAIKELQAYAVRQPNAFIEMMSNFMFLRCAKLHQRALNIAKL